MAMNLVQHRSASNVWSASGCQAGWDVERLTAGAAAGGLLLSGLGRRSWAGLMLALAGGGLAWWAAAPAEYRRASRARLRQRRAWAPDRVEEALEESFPASDAPSWTPNASHAGSDPWSEQS